MYSGLLVLSYPIEPSFSQHKTARNGSLPFASVHIRTLVYPAMGGVPCQLPSDSFAKAKKSSQSSSRRGGVAQVWIHCHCIPSSNTLAHWHIGTWGHGHMDTWAHGYMGTWTHWCIIQWAACLAISHRNVIYIFQNMRSHPPTLQPNNLFHPKNPDSRPLLP